MKTLKEIAQEANVENEKSKDTDKNKTITLYERVCAYFYYLSYRRDCFTQAHSGYGSLEYRFRVWYEIEIPLTPSELRKINYIEKLFRNDNSEIIFDVWVQNNAISDIKLTWDKNLETMIKE